MNKKEREREWKVIDNGLKECEGEGGDLLCQEDLERRARKSAANRKGKKRGGRASSFGREGFGMERIERVKGEGYGV